MQNKNNMGLKLGKILGGVLKVVDKVALGGVIGNKNKDTAESPKGQIDKMSLIKGILFSVAMLVLLYLLVTGKISFDEFIEGVEVTSN